MTERERIVPAAVAAVTLALLGLVVTLWRPLAPALPPGLPELATFDPVLLDAIEAYRGPRYVGALVGAAVTLLVPVLLAVTPPGRRLLARLAGPRAHAPLRVGLLTGGVAVVTSLAVLPLSAWFALVHEDRWGFRVRTTVGWLRDWVVVSAGRWALLAGGALVLVVAVRRWPRSWPYRVTLLVTTVTAVIVLVHPLVLQPLLLPTAPMPPGEARDAVADVLAGAGREDAPILVGEASLRTTRVNALVTGIGPTERVVVYDTLLELPPDQVAGVVAHELAHQEHGDLVRGTLGSATLALPLLLLLRRGLRRLGPTDDHDGADRGPRDGSGDPRPRGPTDPRLAAAAVAVVLVVELVGAPVVNLVSRRLEAAADARAIELTDDAATIVRTVRTFVVRDLSSPSPPAWAQLLYGSHPSPRDRVRAAVALAEERGLPLPDLAELEAEEDDLRHPRVPPRPVADVSAPSEPDGR